MLPDNLSFTQFGAKSINFFPIKQGDSYLMHAQIDYGGKQCYQLFKLSPQTRQIKVVQILENIVLGQVTSSKYLLFHALPDNSTNFAMLDVAHDTLVPVSMTGDIVELEADRCAMLKVNRDTQILVQRNKVFVVNLNAGTLYKIFDLPECIYIDNIVLDNREQQNKHLVLYGSTCYYGGNVAHQFTISIPTRLVYSLASSVGQELFSMTQLCDAHVQSATSKYAVHSLVIRFRAPKLYSLIHNGIASLIAYSDIVVKGIIDFCYTGYISGLNDTTGSDDMQQYIAIAKKLDLPEVSNVCSKYTSAMNDDKLDAIKIMIAEKQFAKAEAQLIKLGKSAPVLALRGLLEKANGKPWQALEFFVQALELDSTNLGYINAIAALQHTLKHAPVQKESLWLLSHQVGVAKTFSKLVANPELSDFAIVISSESIPVHKLFLRTQSEFFDNLVADDDETSNATLVIDGILPGLTKELLLRLLSFVYTGYVNLLGLETEHLCIMLRAASMFGWEAIRDECEAVLTASTSKFTTKLLEFAVLNRCSRLCNAALAKLKKPLPKLVEFNWNSYEIMASNNIEQRGGANMDPIHVIGASHVKGKTISLVQHSFDNGSVIIRNPIPAFKAASFKIVFDSEPSYHTKMVNQSFYNLQFKFCKSELNPTDEEITITIGSGLLSINSVQEKIDGFVPFGKIAVTISFFNFNSIKYLAVEVAQGDNYWKRLATHGKLASPLYFSVNCKNGIDRCLHVTIHDLQAHVMYENTDKLLQQHVTEHSTSLCYCVKCKSQFKPSENNDKACQCHPGTLTQDFYSLDSDERGPLYYTCCKKDPNSAPCHIAYHSVAKLQ